MSSHNKISLCRVESIRNILIYCDADVVNAKTKLIIMNAETGANCSIKANIG